MLSIGPIAIDPPVVLAPMAGITNAAFRGLCREYGAGLYVSEMVSAQSLAAGHPGTEALLDFGPAEAGETVRSVQLYAVDPADAYTAVRRVTTEYGAAHVDLNFGCPTAKITRKGGGAAIPARPALLAAILAAAVRAAGDVPVTMKMRIGLSEALPTHLVAGRIAAAEGIAAVALHARTAEQLYSGTADWTAIGELAATLDGTPVLGNGDVWSAADALAMLRQTGCAGVVVGRGCLGRPWLFRDLAAAFRGEPEQPPPALAEVAAVLARHTRALVERHGDERAGCRDARKHTQWYLAGYPVPGELLRRLAVIDTISALDELLAEVLAGAGPDTRPPDGREWLPRGQNRGPQRVALPDGWLARTDALPPIEAAGIGAGG